MDIRRRSISGSILDHVPPASPQPIRGIWTEASSSAALTATAPSAVSIASYRTGTPLLPVRMPRWPTMLATQR